MTMLTAFREADERAKEDALKTLLDHKKSQGTVSKAI
jgi:hypothetical protein